MSGLVLLHGFTGDSTSWEPVRSFVDPGRRVLCPTLLGHGEEARDPNVRTFEAEVDRVARSIGAAGFSGAHLCGYSLGARVALGLLVRHPGAFSRATLIGVNAGIDDDRERAERAKTDQAWASMLEREGIERFIDAWESQPLFSTQSSEARRRERARRAQRDPHELARSLAVLGLAAMPSYWSSLQEIEVPVHLIAGGEDSKFGGIAERMLPLLPHGELTIVPGAGHNLPLERPEVIARALA